MIITKNQKEEKVETKTSKKTKCGTVGIGKEVNKLISNIVIEDKNQTQSPPLTAHKSSATKPEGVLWKKRSTGDYYAGIINDVSVLGFYSKEEKYFGDVLLKNKSENGELEDKGIIFFSKPYIAKTNGREFWKGFFINRDVIVFRGEKSKPTSPDFIIYDDKPTRIAK
jgi:hypothetical protein